MMTTEQILAELEQLGRASYKRVLVTNHGVKEPCCGVPIGELQKIRRRIGRNHALALALYDTGNYDAMYLAGLIADDPQMTRRDLQHWVEQAYGGSLPGATVPWVAAGSAHGWEIAREWIDSGLPLVASSGWATLASLVSVKADRDLDLPALESLMQRVESTIRRAPDVVRYQMNAFIIAVGCFVQPLSQEALRTAERIGPVTADLGNNRCEVPFAPDYIRKVADRGTVGRKRKSAKC